MASSLNESCVFCSGDHSSTYCISYATVAMRLQRLKNLNRCERCLQEGHIPSQCRDYTSCGICSNTSHHISVCRKTARAKSALLRKNPEKCIFCYQHYHSTECRRFSTAESRMDYVVRNKCCIRCLKHHSMQPCQEDPEPCDYCGMYNHHKALCRGNPFLQENRKLYPAYGICVFCEKHQKAANCRSVRDLETRKQILETQGRCNSCLRLHATATCIYRCRCQICGSSEHHQVICPQNPFLIVGTSPSSDSSTSSSSVTSENDEEPDNETKVVKPIGFEKESKTLKSNNLPLSSSPSSWSSPLSISEFRPRTPSPTCTSSSIRSLMLYGSLLSLTDFLPLVCGSDCDQDDSHPWPLLSSRSSSVSSENDEEPDNETKIVKPIGFERRSKTLKSSNLPSSKNELENYKGESTTAFREYDTSSKGHIDNVQIGQGSLRQEQDIVLRNQRNHIEPRLFVHWHI